MPSAGVTHNFAAFLLLGKAAQNPEHVVARCGGNTLSRALLNRQAFAMAAFFRSQGLEPGSRVLMVLPDSFSFLTAFLGCLLAGIVAAPVNNRLRQADYADCILGCTPGLVLATAQHEALEAAREAGVPALALDDQGLPGLLEGVAPIPFHPSRAEDICVLFVTSGTTGPPKIIPHRHSDLFSMNAGMKGFFDLQPGDVVLCSAKMCHGYGLLFSLTLPLEVGVTAVLDPAKPGPENTLRLLLDEQVTVFASVPAIYTLLLLSSWAADRMGALRLCFSAGEALPAAVFTAWLEKTGRPIWQGYGSTELTTFAIGCRPPHIVPGTAGSVIPPCQARIQDQDGEPVPDGVPGHLAVLSSTTMPGYLNAPEWNSRVFTPDGWLLTGDMAVREQGVYTILGRMDDMFKAGGLWVSPTRVENAFLSLPAVAQCAVTSGFVGAFSMVRAHVVLAPGWEPNLDTAAALRRQAAETLPDFMVPAEVVFHETLPMTATGKVQRFKLRSAAQ